MNVTREVIVDLLPLYLAGECSPATRNLVEEYLRQDPDLAQKIRPEWAADLGRLQPPALRPEIEIRSLKRTRTLLTWQRCLFGFALFFTAFGSSVEYSIRNGHFQEFHFLVWDHPVLFGAALSIAVACWILYFYVRRHLRTGGF